GLMVLIACGGGSQGSVPPNPVLRSIQVTGATANLTAGQTEQMKAIGTYSNNTSQDLSTTANWSSSDATVCTVAADGLVTTFSNGGACSISASVGGISGSFSIAVVPGLVSIAVTPRNPFIAPGTTQQFIAIGTYSDNTTQNVTSTVSWSSSDMTVA